MTSSSIATSRHRLVAILTYVAAFWAPLAPSCPSSLQAEDSPGKLHQTHMATTIASPFAGQAVVKAAGWPCRSARRSRAAVVVPRAALESQRMATPFDGFKFESIRESQISRAMTQRYFQDLHDHAEVGGWVGGWVGGVVCVCVWHNRNSRLRARLHLKLQPPVTSSSASDNAPPPVCTLGLPCRWTW